MALANNSSTLFSIIILFPLVFLLNPAVSQCPKTFDCGSIEALKFPLAMDPECGLFLVNGCGPGGHPKIQFDVGDRQYDLLHKHSTNKFSIRDPVLRGQLENQNCDAFETRSLPKSPYALFSISPNCTFVKCFKETSGEDTQRRFENYYTKNCQSINVYYTNQSIPRESDISHGCDAVELPVRPGQDPGRVFDLLTSEFTIEWNVPEDCYGCHYADVQCLTDKMKHFLCKRRGRNQVRLILAITLSGGGFVLLCFLAACFFWQRKKRINKSYLLSRSISYDPSSKSNVEGASSYFGIPIFSYTELEEATNNFDESKELGDGGFGTVYFGKLRDGREVAIKRLYEHNYKRVEQFMNEIKILTCLRHRNLVSLYGCTSRRSRELLLVYEYIPNGTVADHLHGEQAKEAPLTWPIRMSIAIETASALAYLHKSDIIHRDVKTNNILLDSNFCVKVADFGLSRLFPNDVTHISTAPQGTPGYVDPEYHQCYQLTDKSDVYSFGVVLIELISSMPAVDISRHRHEINLANLAVNRIQRCAFDELIDPSLGYETDDEIKRMTTTVAELAFRCLQLEKEMRPSMDEVVNLLGDIQSGVEGEKIKGAKPGKIPHSPETDDTVLLKKKYYQSSPNAVTDVWVSGSSTTTSSIGG